ncbi:unnamed protein product [Ambrosiozyma monospora]|uniref:Unnamed protein product n=1 Tax=Ambrosiozyma monospora TaxID=43982 RepID=A0A9W6YYT2_AMBMO|nr:unnamed protein product [Ambrosiozyma monospora]
MVWILGNTAYNTVEAPAERTVEEGPFAHFAFPFAELVGKPPDVVVVVGPEAEVVEFAAEPAVVAGTGTAFEKTGDWATDKYYPVSLIEYLGNYSLKFVELEVVVVVAAAAAVVVVVPE